VAPKGTHPPSFTAALPDDAYLDPREWVDDLPTADTKRLPPSNATRPSLWRPRHDKGDKSLTEERHITSRDEYRHMLWYGTYHATFDTALETFMDAIRQETYFSQEEADTWGLFDATKRTHMVCCSAQEGKLTYVRRLKCEKLLTGEKRVVSRKASRVLHILRQTCGGTERQRGPRSTQRQMPRSQPTRRRISTSVSPVQTTTNTRRQLTLHGVPEMPKTCFFCTRENDVTCKLPSS
jgi:hypothetical protein